MLIGDDPIESLCLREMAVWNRRRVPFASALSEYQQYNDTRYSTFLLRIGDGQVSVVDKPKFYTRVQIELGSNPYTYAVRVYRDFIQQVVEEQALDLDAVVALDIDDRGLSSPTAPVFVISKPTDRESVLLPHYEFMMADFHESDNDDIPYSCKELGAIFAGSTTGRYFDETDIENLSLPRLRAAMYFKDHPRVDFRLTNIVQCTPGAERMLRDLGFGGGHCPWNEQFKKKFLISMDGNAGTCSRISVSLKSNCVLLKYHSDYVMHYFHNLQPWVHYAPIGADDEIDPILQIEESSPGFFEHIAREGTRFFRNHLQRPKIVEYTARLLSMYVASFQYSSPSETGASLDRAFPATARSARSKGASSMVSPSDVIAVYRTVLGRDPENEQVIADQMAAADSIDQLYRNFISSEEFRENFCRSLAPSDLPNPHKPLDWPPIPVESSLTDPRQLAAMFARVRTAWARYGEQEPYFSVCTNSDLRGREIGEHAAEFYASGRQDVHYLLSFAARSGIELAGRTCFELGCGVGRVTRWLAPIFRRVHAADVSPGHLAIAHRILAEEAIENVSFTQLHGLEDLRQIVGFDVFFSVIVLQHNPPPAMAYILTQVLTNINPGGVAFFQVPTYARGYAFGADHYIEASADVMPEMEMHVLPQRDIFRIIDSTGCRLLELREDGYTGDGRHISNTFFVQKNG